MRLKLPKCTMKGLMAAVTLKRTLLVCMVLRFVYVVGYLGPMHNLDNDWGRHWSNGVWLFEKPQMMSAVDPKFYQLWVWFVHAVTGGVRWQVNAVSGLLCAITPYIWFRVAREVFSKRAALWFGIFVAVHPSFLTIYSFFMNETLLLPMVGAAIWGTLRAVRRQSDMAYGVAVLCWVLAVHTRMVALPLMVFSVAWMISAHRHKLRALGVAVGMMVVVSIPAGIQSYRVVNAFLPLQFGTLNGVYLKSGSKIHEYYIKNPPFKGKYGWSSPSYYQNPYDPFGKFESTRLVRRPPVVIDFNNGVKDFEDELKLLNAEYTLRNRVRDTWENFVFLVFAPSWPDSTVKWHDPFFRANYFGRWVWPPLMLVMFAGLFVQQSEKRNYIVLLALGLFATLALQQTGIMEGRYRKPLEPLLVMVAMMVVSGWRSKEGEYPLHCAVRKFVKPLWLGVRRWL